jgi:hypothetical protein
MDKTLEIAVKPRLILKAGNKEYTVEYPLSAVVRAEANCNRSLKCLADWFQLEWTDVHRVLHAGISPEVSAEDIRQLCEDLGAEGVLEIRHALMCLNFPRTMERCEAAAQKGISPNAGGGANS